MFILFDPIFWINKTLATFDRLINKLHKQVEKCEKEADGNIGAMSTNNAIADAKSSKAEIKAKKKIEKAKNKVTVKTWKIDNKRIAYNAALSKRNEQLALAKKRATNTAKNLSALMGE